jgi:hypothetical protein
MQAKGIQQSNQSLFILHQISFFDKKIGDLCFCFVFGSVNLMKISILWVKIPMSKKEEKTLVGGAFHDFYQFCA